MAKAGLIVGITERDKDFAGSGVEGQKGADQTGEDQKPPVLDTEGATSIITHRDGPKRVWFRDGKEIGVENVG